MKARLGSNEVRDRVRAEALRLLAVRAVARRLGDVVSGVSEELVYVRGGRGRTRARRVRVRGERRTAGVIYGAYVEITHPDFGVWGVRLFRQVALARGERCDVTFVHPVLSAGGSRYVGISLDDAMFPLDRVAGLCASPFGPDATS